MKKLKNFNKEIELFLAKKAVSKLCEAIINT